MQGAPSKQLLIEPARAQPGQVMRPRPAWAQARNLHAVLPGSLLSGPWKTHMTRPPTLAGHPGPQRWHAPHPGAPEGNGGASAHVAPGEVVRAVLGERAPEVPPGHVLGDEHDLVAGQAGAQELHDVDVAQALQDGDLVAEARALLGRVPRHELDRDWRVALPDALVDLRARAGAHTSSAVMQAAPEACWYVRAVCGELLQVGIRDPPPNPGSRQSKNTSKDVEPAPSCTS